MISPRSSSPAGRASRRSGGFVLLAVLVLLAGMLLGVSALLSGGGRVLNAVRLSSPVAQLNSAVDSGLAYAETEVRTHDFSELLKGANGVPDTTAQAARQLAFRNPLSRTAALSQQWGSLALEGSDDGLLFEHGTVMHVAGLVVNGVKLFFKVTNNPEDPGGPFRDDDDTVVLRVVAVAPLPAALQTLGSAHNICEVAEIRLRRVAAFLGPAALYSPSGRLDVDLSDGGRIRGRVESGSGSAIAFGGEPPNIISSSGSQIDGSVQDLSGTLDSDFRLRWLAQDSFVDHWTSRIDRYASEPDWEALKESVQWATSGIDLSGTESLKGVVFSSGPVVLRDAASVQGLLVLVGGASLEMFDSASVAGTLTTVGKDRSFSVRLHGDAAVEYRPSLALEAVRLLPLSRTLFRYITPEMEP